MTLTDETIPGFLNNHGKTMLIKLKIFKMKCCQCAENVQKESNSSIRRRTK